MRRQFGAAATMVGNDIIVGGRTVVDDGVIIDSGTGEPVVPRRYNLRNVQELRGTVRFTPAPGITNDTIVTFHQDKNSGTNTGALLLVRNAAGVPVGTEPSVGYGSYVGYLSSSQLRPRNESYG